MSTNDVLLLKDAAGETYAIPIDKLQGAKLKREAQEVHAAVSSVNKAEYSILGVASMPQSVRKAAYATPTVMSNVNVAMPTA